MGLSRGRVSGGLLGLAISIGAGWLALRHVSLHEVWQALQEAHYWYLAPALAALSAGRRAARRALAGDVPARRTGPGFMATFWALVLGLFANNVLPARLGEIARMAALSRETGLRRTQVLTTIAVERVFDLAALGLIAAVDAAARAAGSLRRNLGSPSIVIFAVLAVSCSRVASPRVRSLVDRLVRRLPVLGGARGERTVGSLRAGIDSLRDKRGARDRDGLVARELDLARASRTTSCCSMFDTGAPWQAAVLALLATNLAMVVPSSAASIGVFEVAARRRSPLYGVPAALALSFALVLHAVNILPTLPSARSRSRGSGSPAASSVGSAASRTRRAGRYA